MAINEKCQCRVSVCIATFNGEKFIQLQLDSIMRQLGKTDEIVISDDGSDDHTVDIIQNVGYPRLRLFSNPVKTNVAKNFENALQQARGQYIFLADQDDLWMPGKVDILLSWLKIYDLVVSDCEIIDETGACIYPSYFVLRRSGKGVIKNIKANSFIGSCMAFDRSVLHRALPFPKNIPMHDWWIGLVGEVFGTTFFCSEKLVQYRRHSENLSPFITSRKYGWLQKILFRKNLILPLTIRWMTQKYLNGIQEGKKAIL
jgi:glycosyltransferase involved in cell wall biosynthesis